MNYLKKYSETITTILMMLAVGCSLFIETIGFVPAVVTIALFGAWVYFDYFYMRKDSNNG